MSFLYVERDTMPEAWEEAVLRCWNEGDRVRTEYDKAADPESRDCTATIVVRQPFKEPRIHRAFPGSLDYLEIYRQEVVDGIHDHWVDPAAGKWSYTYHQRLFAYDLRDAQGRKRVYDQFAILIDKLAATPHTRRAQAITWKPDVDTTVHDPACLQRMWFRVFGDELRMNVHMRSNDAFKATFMNMWAFTDLQRFVAEAVGAKLGRKLVCGAYGHIVDSFHIYGSYFNEFEGFLKSVRDRKFEDRVWDSSGELAQACFDGARQQIAREQADERQTPPPPPRGA